MMVDNYEKLLIRREIKYLQELKLRLSDSEKSDPSLIDEHIELLLTAISIQDHT